VHATTDPVARGRGIFVGLERKHEQERRIAASRSCSRSRPAPTAPLFSARSGGRRIAPIASGRGPAVRREARGAPLERFDSRRRRGAWPNHIVRDCRVSELALSRLAARLRGVRVARATPCSGTSGTAAATSRSSRISSGPRAAAARCSRGVEPGRARLRVPARGRRRVPLLRLRADAATLHFMGKALAAARHRSRAWRFTLGDTDFF
jgi:hypothetical protein